MKTQVVQNNGQKVSFQKIGANRFFKDHFYKELKMTGKDLLEKLNSDEALKAVNRHIEHSGGSNFIRRLNIFGNGAGKIKTTLADTNLTYKSLKEAILSTVKK